jgi:protein-tyrosine kinase
MNVGFGQAALQMYLVTPEELAAATSLAREAATRGRPGLIENAIRRMSSERKALVVRRLTVKASTKLILAHDPHHPRSEQIRSLRTELLMLMNDGGRHARVLALLSPSAKEGRSQLAAETAIAFAQLGRPTLLVDADLRRPGQHLLFGADNGCGLAQALSTREVPPLLTVEGLPKLSIMTAGPKVANPLELLSDGRFERLLADWKREYDFIVIDTPPVSEFADALAVASVAERVLLLSRANVTGLSQMKEMLRRLSTTNSRILGAVISNF